MDSTAHTATYTPAEDGGLRWRAGVIVLFNAAFGVWLLTRPGSAQLVTAIANIAQFTGPLLALPLCLLPLVRSGRRSTPAGGGSAGAFRPSWTPLLLGLGVLCFALGKSHGPFTS